MGTLDVQRPPMAGGGEGCGQQSCLGVFGGDVVAAANEVNLLCLRD